MKYSKKLAAEYIKSRGKYDETDNRLFEILEEIGVEGKAVMDLGCGSGFHMKKIIDMGARAGVCVDISEDMITMARQHNQNTQNVDFFVADGRNVPVDDESQDIVFLNFVLHYFESFDEIFAELARVLRPGGYVLATTNIVEVVVGHEHLYNTSMPIRLGGSNSDVVVENLVKSKDELFDALRHNKFEILKEEELNHPNAIIDSSYAHRNYINKRVFLYLLQKGA